MGSPGEFADSAIFPAQPLAWRLPSHQPERATGQAPTPHPADGECDVVLLVNVL
jgi:hypothetical protein